MFIKLEHFWVYFKKNWFLPCHPCWTQPWLNVLHWQYWCQMKGKKKNVIKFLQRLSSQLMWNRQIIELIFFNISRGTLNGFATYGRVYWIHINTVNKLDLRYLIYHNPTFNLYYFSGFSQKKVILNKASRVYELEGFL